MTIDQQNALKRLQVQIEVLKDQAKSDPLFAQQLREVGLFNCKLEYSYLTIAHALRYTSQQETERDSSINVV